MVTTVSSYAEVRNRAFTGDGYDGVVRVVVGNLYGSGVLLFDGKAVLTAAHLFNNSSSVANVIFGIDLGSTGGSAFAGANLMELMKSRKLIEKTLFGIAILENGELTETHILEEDFNKYEHIILDDYPNSEEIINKIKENNIHFPIVILK